MTDKKAALVAGGLGLAGLVGYLVTRKVKAAPPEGAAIGIEIIPVGYSPPVGFPAEIIEGQSYIVRVTITNQSTKAGTPWEATLILTVGAMAGGVWLIFPTDKSEHFAAGQTRAFDYPMDVPLGTGGLSGMIDAVVSTPEGVPFASASEPITITSITIDYGATVVIGV